MRYLGDPGMRSAPCAQSMLQLQCPYSSSVSREDVPGHGPFTPALSPSLCILLNTVAWAATNNPS